MGTLVSLIRPDNFEQEVMVEKKPVLLLCMPPGEEFPKQVRLLEDIVQEYGKEMKVAVLEENFIAAFKKNYGFVGTPTFLILVEGRERGRMLGLADHEALTNLILHFQRAFPR